MNRRLAEMIDAGSIPSVHGLWIDCYSKVVNTTTSGTITTGVDFRNQHFIMNKQNFRIRKLTSRECFRLMDVEDEKIDIIQAAGISNSQQYKIAGNSIVVACLYGIFDKLFVHTEPEELLLF